MFITTSASTGSNYPQSKERCIFIWGRAINPKAWGSAGEAGEAGPRLLIGASCPAVHTSKSSMGKCNSSWVGKKPRPFLTDKAAQPPPLKV